MLAPQRIPQLWIQRRLEHWILAPTEGPHHGQRGLLLIRTASSGLSFSTESSKQKFASHPSQAQCELSINQKSSDRLVQQPFYIFIDIFIDIFRDILPEGVKGPNVELQTDSSTLHIKFHKDTYMKPNARSPSPSYNCQVACPLGMSSSRPV